MLKAVVFLIALIVSTSIHAQPPTSAWSEPDAYQPPKSTWDGIYQPPQSWWRSSNAYQAPKSAWSDTQRSRQPPKSWWAGAPESADQRVGSLIAAAVIGAV
jgi:hypothetical protein